MDVCVGRGPEEDRYLCLTAYSAHASVYAAHDEEGMDVCVGRGPEEDKV